jgi:hypothetical protein
MSGQAPLGTEISGEGYDGVDWLGVHDLTVTKPDAISKDIDAGATCVLPSASETPHKLSLATDRSGFTE